MCYCSISLYHFFDYRDLYNSLGNFGPTWKATQRNILTKERPARLATGGGPEEKVPEIDPDIVFIAPNLLETPTKFSFDLSEAEIHVNTCKIHVFSRFLPKAV